MTTKLETLASLISSSSGSPLVYAYERPSTVKNCITYKLISTVPIRTMSATILEKNRIQLDCWGDTLSKSRALAAKMKTLLDLNKTSFTISYLIDDLAVKDLETTLFRSILDFYIW